MAGPSSWVARLPFYYGWVQVLLAALAMSATFPGRTYGLALIKEPLRADLGIDNLTFNTLNGWAIVLGAVLVPPFGWLIDRLGTRRTLALVCLFLALAVFGMSRVTNSTELFLALTLVRGLGQGALSVVAIALVGKWFRRQVGLAMAVFTILLSFGFLGPILIVGNLVQSQGWRDAWDAVGLALLLGLLPVGLILARSTPESVGIPPDEPASETTAPTVPLMVALTTRPFWLFTLAATLFNLTFSALTLDNELLLKEHGLGADPDANNRVLGILMVSGLPANLLAGLFVRRFAMGTVLGVGLATLTASLMIFPTVTTMNGAMGYAALLGIAGGVITVVYFAVYGQDYGRTHLGSIQSFVQVLTVVASASGPVLLALTREQFGSTDGFFYGFGGLAAVLTLAAVVMQNGPVTSKPMQG